jgi:hypothetical protein
MAQEANPLAFLIHSCTQVVAANVDSVCIRGSRAREPTPRFPAPVKRTLLRSYFIRVYFQIRDLGNRFLQGESPRMGSGTHPGVQMQFLARDPGTDSYAQ